MGSPKIGGQTGVPDRKSTSSGSSRPAGHGRLFPSSETWSRHRWSLVFPGWDLRRHTSFYAVGDGGRGETGGVLGQKIWSPCPWVVRRPLSLGGTGPGLGTRRKGTKGLSVDVGTGPGLGVRRKDTKGVSVDQGGRRATGGVFV